MKIKYFALALFVTLVGCKPAGQSADSASEPKTYSGHGVVVSVDADHRHAKIKHDAITNYMAAMTMDFPVLDTNELESIVAGDEISFTLAVTETNDWIENIRVVGKTNILGLAGPTGWHVSEPELEVGDKLPDYEFTDEHGRTTRFADFRGEVVAFTFFFTSCPLPDYCPRMNRNFAETRKILTAATNAPAKWELMSISFDPTVDSPQVLSSYAQLYRSQDTNHWLFVVASTNTLAGLAPRVDLSVWHEAGTLSHNMRTVVLDSTGRISAQLDGNDWTAQQLADAICKAGEKH